MEKLKLSYEDLGAMCADLALLLHSGMGTADALSVLAADTADPKLSERLAAMAGEADMGETLSSLFAKDPSFPGYLQSLLKVGESTGHTEETLQSLSDYYYGQARLSAQLRDALVYPSILLVIMLLVIGVLLIKVLPIFNDVYKQLGTSLTGVAGGLLAAGSFLGKIMPVLAVLLLAIVVFVLVFANSESFREKVLIWWRKRRGDKGLSWDISSAHFSQAFAMGLSSGMPTEDAVELAAGVMADIPAAKAHCDECLTMIADGKPLAEALSAAKLLPLSESRLLATALKSGAADASIRSIAARLTERGERAVRQTVSRVEPALVIISCILVGLILLTVMLPLMNIMSAIG